MNKAERIENDARALMQVVRQGSVDDSERVRIATMAFMFGMRAAIGKKNDEPTPPAKRTA